MKKSTKVMALLCALTMSIGLFTACGSNTEKKESESKEKAKYTAVTEATFPPFDTTDEQGNLIGFDMDLMNAIGEDQGFTVEYKNMGFDALIPALQAGNADIITAGMNAEDPDRQKKVDFSTTYYDSGLVVLVKNTSSVKGVDSLTSSMKVASQIGTTGADKVNELKSQGKIGEAIINKGFDTCLLQLQNGDIDAVIIDKPVAEQALGKYKELHIVGDVLNAESFGFAVQKGNKELLDKINKGLENLKKNGTYDKIYKKWFS